MSEFESNDAQVNKQIALPRILEASTINELHRQLKDVLADLPDQVMVNSTDVTVADTSAIQLLIAFVRAVEAIGSKLVWGNISPEIKKIASMLGLQEELKLQDS